LEFGLSERFLEGLVFIGIIDTNAALKRIEKNEKMRRTGQNPRRTGQRGENGGGMRADFLDRRIRLRKNNSGGTKQNRSGERLLQTAWRVSVLA
jgi:predicted metalloprotease